MSWRSYTCRLSSVNSEAIQALSKTITHITSVMSQFQSFTDLMLLGNFNDFQTSNLLSRHNLIKAIGSDSLERLSYSWSHNYQPIKFLWRPQVLARLGSSCISQHCHMVSDDDVLTVQPYEVCRELLALQPYKATGLDSVPLYQVDL